MKDFLTFKLFISSYTLIWLYYIGAVIIPFIAWIVFFKYFRKFYLYKNAKKAFSTLPFKYKITSILLFILTFLCMEVCWRMAIEFLLAYMQIRDALVK